MSPPAGRATLSRRAFLGAAGAAGGGLLLWFSTGQSARSLSVVRRFVPGQLLGSTGLSDDVDSWLRLEPDGTVRLFTAKVEFGQGIQTALAQLVSEELDVPIGSIAVLMGSTEHPSSEGPTYGSSSMSVTGAMVRRAAAEMRQWLLELGSRQLNEPIDALTTAAGAVTTIRDANRSANYAQLATGQLTARKVRSEVQLKPPASFTVIGTSAPRVDIPSIVTGETRFGYEAGPPGALHGKVLRPPSLGAMLIDVDLSVARAMTGVAGVVHDGQFVGLAAERRDQVEEALRSIRATWQQIASPQTHENVHELLRNSADGGRSARRGDPDARLTKATRRISVRVRAPYLAHLPLEPQSAVAQPTDDTLEVWASTQAPFQLRQTLASELKRPAESIIVHAVRSGGAFGRKVDTEAPLEAARMALALKRPVRINWTREEEFQLDRFRPAMAIELETGIDDRGTICGWNYDLYAAAYYTPLGQAPMATAADAGSQADALYELPDIRTTFYQSQSPLPVGIWRANGSPVNALARETAIDELAEAAGANPVAFRERLLTRNPRMLAVMRAAVQKAAWTPGVGATRQGIGLALDFAQGTWVAEVAHVALDESSGKLKVQHVDVAVDCGLVVNPDGARAQIEGGIVGQGVSSTLNEMVTFAEGRITNASVAAYAPLRCTEAPSVDVVFVEDKSQPMQGLGEPAVCPVSAAISNAAYDLLGVRLRDLPFTPDKIRAAIAA